MGPTVRIVLSPIPDSVMDAAALASRASVGRHISARLAGASLLDTPPNMPDDEFAGFAHLNAAGRQVFSRALASALAHR